MPRDDRAATPLRVCGGIDAGDKSERPVRVCGGVIEQLPDGRLGCRRPDLGWLRALGRVTDGGDGITRIGPTFPRRRSR